MKKFLVFLVILGVGGFLLGDAHSKELKVGYVDIFKVFNEYGKTKKYDEMLEEKKTKREKSLDAKREKIEKMQSKLSLLKDKKQQKQQEKIAQEIKDYRTEEQQILADLKEERDKRMKEIIADIDKVIKNYAKKEGFDLIINENIVLYGSGVMDITQEILKKVNK